ncbi:hypothetical protein TNCV_3631641 [Trichonephila clavipes]|nr:hypothetical protein TNCV_3631641 [Trichonephila clavipes]
MALNQRFLNCGHRPRCSAGLNSFRTLGIEDLRAPLALVDPRMGSWIRLIPVYLGPKCPMDNLHCSGGPQHSSGGGMQRFLIYHYDFPLLKTLKGLVEKLKDMPS